MDAPLVSVIVAVHNGERWIRTCLDSVLGQLHRTVELIVINDGSTDSTADLLSTCDDNRLKVQHTENRGLSAARNLGMRIACGDLITFLDADDILPPWSLARRVEALLRNGVDAVVTPKALNVQDAFPFVFVEEISKATPMRCSSITSGLEILKRQCEGSFWAVPQCYVIDRSRCQVPEFDEMFAFMVDNEWLTRFLPRCERIGVLEGWDYIYRVSPASMSKSRSMQRAARAVQQHRILIERTKGVVLVDRQAELRATVQAVFRFWPHVPGEMRKAFLEAAGELGRDGVLACIGVPWAERVGRFFGWRGAILALRLRGWVKRRTLRLATWLARL